MSSVRRYALLLTVATVWTAVCGVLAVAYSPLPALAVAALPVVMASLPLLARWRAQTVVVACCFIFVAVNGDYPKHEAPTEPLAELLLSPIGGAPPPGELVAYVLMAWALAHVLAGGAWLRRGALPSELGGDAFRVLGVVTLAPVVAVVAASIYGVLSDGGQLRIVLWQTRAVPVLMAWAIAGYYACRHVADITRLLDILVVAAVLKSLYSLAVFFDVHHGSLASQKLEYVTSHEISLFLGVALVYMTCRLLAMPGRFGRAAWLAPMSLVGLHWLVNERRISYLGVGFSVVFALPFLRPLVRRWHVGVAAALALLAVLYFAATWSNPDNMLRQLVEPGVDSSADYREIENFDQYYVIARHPLFGVGFGKPFQQLIKLPDIFKIAEFLRWVPHNNILMVWSMGGPLALAGLGVCISFAMAAYVRVFRCVTEVETRIAAFTGFSAIVQWTLYCWADMGLTSAASCMLAGTTIGYGFKLLHLRRSAC